MEGACLSTMMTICDKPTVSILLNGKKLKAFTLTQKHSCLFPLPYIPLSAQPYHSCLHLSSAGI